MFGTFGLNYLNRKLDLMKLRLYSGIFATSLTLLLVYFFKDFGAALSFLIAEIFSSDQSVTKKGFRASWAFDRNECNVKNGGCQEGLGTIHTSFLSIPSFLLKFMRD